MAAKRVAATNENLQELGAPLLAKWLVEAALTRSSLTYGEAKSRLESEHGFTGIGRATRIGVPAGRLMADLQAVEEDAPLLNVLLVLQADRMPSTGAGGFLADHFGVSKLRQKDIRTSDPELWRRYFEVAAKEVYDFRRWPRLYKKTYGIDYRPSSSHLSPRNPSSGTERDGMPRGRTGEGPNHKALRIWTRGNSGKVFPSRTVLRAETECDLDSGDRVDVVYYTSYETIAIEVKSRDSNEADLQRGLFQCVKYRAVLKAMDPRVDSHVEAVLLTEMPLPGYLQQLAKRLLVIHKEVAPVRGAG